MLEHRKFSAYISSDGIKLPEQEVTINEDKDVVTCYIPTLPGKPFTVHWRDHGTRQTTCSFITLDGENVPGRYLFGEGVASRKGIRCPETEDKERPFMFSEYNTLSRKSGKRPRGSAKLSNCIMLRIYQIKVTSSKPQTNSITPARKLADPAGPFIDYGDPVPAMKRVMIAWDVDKKEREKIVTFIFKYKPLDLLLARNMKNAGKPAEEPVSPSVPTQPPPAPPKPSPAKGKRRQMTKIDAETAQRLATLATTSKSTPTRIRSKSGPHASSTAGPSSAAAGPSSATPSTPIGPPLVGAQNPSNQSALPSFAMTVPNHHLPPYMAYGPYPMVPQGFMPLVVPQTPTNPAPAVTSPTIPQDQVGLAAPTLTRMIPSMFQFSSPAPSVAPTPAAASPPPVEPVAGPSQDKEGRPSSQLDDESDRMIVDHMGSKAPLHRRSAFMLGQGLSPSRYPPPYITSASVPSASMPSSSVLPASIPSSSVPNVKESHPQTTSTPETEPMITSSFVPEDPRPSPSVSTPRPKKKRQSGDKSNSEPKPVFTLPDGVLPLAPASIARARIMQEEKEKIKLLSRGSPGPDHSVSDGKVKNKGNVRSHPYKGKERERTPNSNLSKPLSSSSTGQPPIAERPKQSSATNMPDKFRQLLANSSEEERRELLAMLEIFQSTKKSEQMDGGERTMAVGEQSSPHNAGQQRDSTVSQAKRKPPHARSPRFIPSQWQQESVAGDAPPPSLDVPSLQTELQISHYEPVTSPSPPSAISSQSTMVASGHEERLSGNTSPSTVNGDGSHSMKDDNTYMPGDADIIMS